MKYANIVFQQEQDAVEAEEILDEHGIESAVKYLSQWDMGEYHEINNKPQYGKSDEVYEVGEYILSYNSSLPYIGLERKIKDHE